MATLTIDDLLDLTKATLKDLGVGRFQQIAQQTQYLEVFSRWFKKDRMMVSGGTGIQRNLMLKLPNAARHVGELEPDVCMLEDLMAQMSVPWRMVTTSWPVMRKDALINKGKSFVFDVVKPRRAGAMLALAELLETAAWSCPVAANKTDPYGVPYWIVKNATTGFNGGLPSDHTTVGGINITDNPNFKNYTVQYTALSKADGIPALRDMHYSIRWKSPVEVPQYAKELADQFRIYCNRATGREFENLGEAQNENLGRDVAPMWVGDVSRGGAGNIMFRGHPVICVPQLASDTQDPVYMINHATFAPYVLEGDYLHEQTKPAPTQRNVLQNFVDMTYNYVCLDRRQNGVMAKA